MKKLLSLFLVFGLMVLGLEPALAQIPNAGFENWAVGPLAGTSVPVGWNGFVYPGVNSIAKGTPAHSGSYALKGTVIAVPGTNVPLPVLVTSMPAFPWLTRSATLTGYYEFFPAAGSTDSMYIVAIFYGGSSGVTIMAAGGGALPPSSTYKQFSEPIIYAPTSEVGFAPDSAQIEIALAGSFNLAASTPGTVGSYFLLDDLAFSGIAPLTAVTEQGPATPRTFELQQNYPNPFNPSTRISFSVAQPGNVELKVYNVLGTEVATLVNEHKSPGQYSVNWNASGLPSGVYLCRMNVSSEQGVLFTGVRRLVLLK